MDSIPASFFFEHSLEIRLMVVVLSIALAFALIQLGTLAASVTRLIAAKLRMVGLNGVFSSRDVAVSQ